jgi:2-oxoglutarate ferredoxin oxidoreductase subunit delta
LNVRLKPIRGHDLKGYIKIKKDLCKECHLCIHFCPKGHIAPSKEYNAQGYHPVCIVEEKECNGCAICATMCPDIAIEVYRE